MFRYLLKTQLDLKVTGCVSNVIKCSVRNSSTKEIKKFYKNVTITQSEGGYEINLDKRKLKTPMGSVFQVPTEALALSVMTEWHAQKDVIKRHSMHMTSLCNTAIDNPTQRSREVVINGILDFLETDTICYRLNEPEELAELQKQEWDPVIHWLKQRYNVAVNPTYDISVPDIPEETLAVLRQHLESFNDWALVGYQNCVESLKSLLLTLALVDRYLIVEQAVALTRLEEAFQVAKWGNVEEHHDVDVCTLRANISAALLFTHLNMEDHRTVFNKSQAGRPV